MFSVPIYDSAPRTVANNTRLRPIASRPQFTMARCSAGISSNASPAKSVRLAIFRSETPTTTGIPAISASAITERNPQPSDSSFPNLFKTNKSMFACNAWLPSTHARANAEPSRRHPLAPLPRLLEISIRSQVNKSLKYMSHFKRPERYTFDCTTPPSRWPSNCKYSAQPQNNPSPMELSR
jgi:hypothetical protein